MPVNSVSRTLFEEYLDEKDEAEEYVATAHGYLVWQSNHGGKKATAYGRMAETKGWIVDVVGGDREWLHFVPLESVLTDEDEEVA